MKTLWFIEQQSTNHRLSYLVQELGCEVVTRPYAPFQEDVDFSFLPVDRPVVFYGSINMVKRFNASPLKDKIKPFCWFDFEEMSCRNYYTHWGQYLLQSNYAFYTFGEIVRLQDVIYQKFGKKGYLFIRPDTNDKAFTGEVVHQDNFAGWADLQKEWGTGLLQLCVVSSPEDIKAEYRLVIAKGEVIASSRYRLDKCIDKKRGCPVEVENFAEKVVNTVPWQPAPIYCMDIAMTSEGPRLLEIGEVNCAGFYDMDLYPVAKAMTEIAENGYIIS